MDEHQRNVGQRIAQLREQKGLTQDELGDLVGVKEKTISRWENGHGGMYLSNLKRLARALGVEPDDIRGTPPTPLGLGHDGLTSGERTILKAIDDVIERLERIERQPPGEAA